MERLIPIVPLYDDRGRTCMTEDEECPALWDRRCKAGAAGPHDSRCIVEGRQMRMPVATDLAGLPICGDCPALRRADGVTWCVLAVCVERDGVARPVYGCPVWDRN
jgi:hypothetical protein